MSETSHRTAASHPYKTVAGEGNSEIVVDRSRFLGFARHVDSVDEATAFVDALEKEHYDARHVCFGLRVGRGPQMVDRSNDDGEPARTGGFPLWQILDGEEVTDAIIAVVRYYGGVKLGTGGLARAYREAGRLALEEAGVETRHPETSFDLQVPYRLVDKIEYMVEQDEAIRVVETDYAADVTFRLAVRTLQLDRVRERLAGLLECHVDEISPGGDDEVDGT